MANPADTSDAEADQQWYEYVDKARDIAARGAAQLCEAVRQAEMSADLLRRELNLARGDAASREIDGASMDDDDYLEALDELVKVRRALKRLRRIARDHQAELQATQATLAEEEQLEAGVAT